MTVRLGTRGSDLALWQAHHVAGRLEPQATEIVIIKTKGDRIDDVPLTADLGKAFFTAEIEQALLDERVDLAVHSHKDLATENPPELAIVAVPARGPAAELLVIGAAHHDKDAPFLPLATGATIGTSSPRRREQLAALRPDLRIEHLRGNVPTRVGKVHSGALDAILVAQAGVHRLELDTAGLVTLSVPTDLIVPAPAQGALAIQTRAADTKVAALCTERLHDTDTAAIIAAERSLLGRAGGGCSLPLGVYIEPQADGFSATGFLGADQPAVGAPARWARATGATPDAAAESLWSVLEKNRPTGVGPLAGTSVLLLGTSTGDSHTGRQLLALGVEVTHVAVTRADPVPAPELIDRLAALRAGDVVAVTSRHAAARLTGLRPGAGVRVAAVGPATARALEAAGLAVDVIGPGHGAGLGQQLDVEEGATVLFPCGADALPDLPAALTARGVEVQSVVVYRTSPVTDVEPLPATDARLYMSPSAVRACVQQGLEHGADTDTLRLALGATTKKALAEAGLSCQPLSAAGLPATLHRSFREPTP